MPTEWSQAGWAADTVGLWHGLIGARNASHHTASPVVAMHGVSEPDDRLIWDLEPAAIEGLPSKRQQTEYNAHLAGQLVLPDLRKMVADVREAVK